MSSDRVAQLIKAGDARLSELDEKSIARLERAVLASYHSLENEVSRKWSDALEDVQGRAPSFAEARARILLKQIERYLALIDQARAAQLSSEHVSVAIKTEESSVQQLIFNYEPNLMTFSRIPIETVTALSVGMTSFLTKHSTEFVDKAQDILIDGMIRGLPFQAMARSLRSATGSTLAAASTVIRTESMRASDTVRRDRYKQANIGYVQRIATMDARVCVFCGARAGSVYPVDSAPQSLHPNDRCYNAPWKLEWFQLGLIDSSWVQRHYQESIAKAGGRVETGPAPFERANGLSAPKPFWTPKDGFV